MWIKKSLLNAMERQIQALNARTLAFRDAVQNGFGNSPRLKRSLNEVYDYPDSYKFEDGYTAIRREGIANRIVSGIANSCWRSGFEIIEGNDPKEGEEILKDEINQLNLRQLFSRLERADVLNRIGPFSVLFVGVPDGLPMTEPLGVVRGDALKSIYFRPFAYDGVQIAQYDTDVESPRFGMPVLYQLQVMGRGDTEKTINLESQMVHWTRCIHMVETPLDSDIEGIPALEPIYNRILDLNKTCGGAAEAYFRNARGKIAFEVDPDFSSQLMNNESARDAFDEAGEKFTNNWQDQIVAVGAKVNAINTPQQSPLDTVKVILWEVSGYTGIPIRVLTGEGSGQLAGSEDRLTYNSLIQDRQDHVCSIWVRRLMEILETAGMITLPSQYTVRFPLQEPLTEIDQAELANKRADTMVKLTEAASSVGGDAIDLQSALDFLQLDGIDVTPFEPPEPPSGFGSEMNPKPLGGRNG